MAENSAADLYSGPVTPESFRSLLQKIFLFLSAEFPGFAFETRTWVELDCVPDAPH